MCQLFLSIKIYPAGYHGVINHIQKTSTLEKEIWRHTKWGERREGGHGKNRWPISGASFGFWPLKDREKKNDTGFFPSNETYVSSIFFFSWQVPQITYMSKKSFLPPAIFYTAGVTHVVRVGWGPTAQSRWFFQQCIHHLHLIGTSQLSSMWCPDSLIMPDGPVNLNLDYALESSGEALGENQTNQPHFQAVPCTNCISISSGETQALII